MQKVIVSFYHCPVNFDEIKLDLGDDFEYNELKLNKIDEIKLRSNFINYFNVYFILGKEIENEAAAKYLDKESGKIFGFITENDNSNNKTVAITSKKIYQQLNKLYRERNLKKILP